MALGLPVSSRPQASPNEPIVPEMTRDLIPRITQGLADRSWFFAADSEIRGEAPTRHVTGTFEGTVRVKPQLLRQGPHQGSRPAPSSREGTVPETVPTPTSIDRRISEGFRDCGRLRNRRLDLRRNVGGQVPVSVTLTFHGEVAERLKAAVC